MKKTMYEIIPVNSGEFPEKQNVIETVSVHCVLIDGRDDLCYYSFKKREWISNITWETVNVYLWLKKVEVDISIKEDIVNAHSDGWDAAEEYYTGITPPFSNKSEYIKSLNL